MSGLGLSEAWVSSCPGTAVNPNCDGPLTVERDIVARRTDLLTGIKTETKRWTVECENGHTFDVQRCKRDTLGKVWLVSLPTRPGLDEQPSRAAHSITDPIGFMQQHDPRKAAEMRQRRDNLSRARRDQR